MTRTCEKIVMTKGTGASFGRCKKNIVIITAALAN